MRADSIWEMAACTQLLLVGPGVLRRKGVLERLPGLLLPCLLISGKLQDRMPARSKRSEQTLAPEARRLVEGGMVFRDDTS